MAADLCSIVDALTASQLDAMRRLNRKFAALRSLAQLLEQLGDLNELVPNIDKLIPVITVDLELYENLVADCPYLNLPPVTTGQINQLQNALVNAYANFFNKLLRHPWNRMGQLQQELLNYQSSLSAGLTEVTDFLRCLQSVCAASQSATGQLQAFSSASIDKEITAFTENFVANSGEVLSAPMQLKYAQITEAKTRLIALGANVKRNYADAKTAAGS